MISIEKKFNNKLTIVKINNLIIYFSYETPIVIYNTAEEEIFVRQNYMNYSLTTSKHMNYILLDSWTYSELNEKDWKELESDLRVNNYS